MTSIPLKKSYRCSQSLQQFYTGGPFTVSSDGSFLVCACNDTIRVVDSSNAAIKSTIEGDSGSITALTLSPDDKFIFSASHSEQIRVWDLETLKCLRSWKGHAGLVMAMTCDASGGLLATAGSDRTVRVWDVDGGFCTHFFKGHRGVVTSIMFHPDPTQLILFSGSDDATIRVWDLTTKKRIGTLDKHFSTVTSMAVTEDGQTLLSAGRDKVVHLWDLRNYSFKATVPTFEVLEAVCIIPTSSPFSSCLDSYKQHRSTKSGLSGIFFVTVGERGIVRLWNSKGAVCLHEQKTSDVTISSDEKDAIRGFTSALMLPSGQGLMCVTADQQFLYYNLSEYPEGCLEFILSKRLVGYNEEIVDMKFLGEDEQYLAVATSVEHVRVYDLATMSCSYVLSGHTDVVLCLDTCISSTGSTLIVTGSKDHSVRVWDTESKLCSGVGIGHMGAVGAVAFSKKRRDFFVSGSSDGLLKAWSLDGLSDDEGSSTKLKAKAVVGAHKKDINSIAISPNDSLVCSGSQDRTAHVWRLPELVSVFVLSGHKRGVWAVEFSPVDPCILTASGDKTIKIWATSNGDCLKIFDEHTSSVTRASFITRGTQIVSCGADGLVKLWNVKDQEKSVATYDQHEDKVWTLAVGKKTEMLATGGSDAVINLWHDCTASDKEEFFRKEEEGILKGQELENALKDADYTKAIQIAFEIRRPHKLFELFSKICRNREPEIHIDKALNDLGKEELRQLLEYVREWNTKPKLCHIAQFVLFRIFNMFPPTQILEIKGVGELLEALIPYCQRHFSRIDRLERSTFLLDYTLMAMSVLEPEVEEKEEGKASLKQLSDTKDVDDELLLKNNQIEEPKKTLDEKNVSSKKRKSKSKNVGHKKVKEVAYVKASAVTSHA